MGPRGRQDISRRALAGAAALLAIAGTTGCTRDDEVTVVLVEQPPASTVLPGADPAETALSLSAALFASAEVAVVATADTVAALAPLSIRAGIPLLVGTGTTVDEELARLDVGTVLTAVGTDLAALGGDLEIVELDPSAADVELPAVRHEGHPVAVTLCVDPAQELPGRAVAAALVESAGGTVLEAPGGDVGRSGDVITAVAATAGEDGTHGVLALGSSFGPADAWPAAVQRAVSTPQLPGGGITAFPGRRMVAMYGSPASPPSGSSVSRGSRSRSPGCRIWSPSTTGLSEEPVVPAFEIISTIASSEPGGDGDFSRTSRPTRCGTARR